LTSVVKTMNQQIVKRSIADKMSFFVGTKLTKRTNALFTKLIGHWLVSDSLVEYFVFTLKGFEFLLDTISSDHKPSSALTIEESKEQFSNNSNDERHSALKGSDLEKLFLVAAEDSKSETINTTAAPTAVD
jgi:hypothetical protein